MKMKTKSTITLDSLLYELTTLYSKCLNSKSFKLHKLYSLCQSYSVLTLYCESSHRQYANKWVWLCSNKTLFTKINRILDLVQGL